MLENRNVMGKFCHFVFHFPQKIKKKNKYFFSLPQFSIRKLIEISFLSKNRRYFEKQSHSYQVIMNLLLRYIIFLIVFSHFHEKHFLFDLLHFIHSSFISSFWRFLWVGFLFSSLTFFYFFLTFLSENLLFFFDFSFFCIFNFHLSREKSVFLLVVLCVL